jgi:hypothetical protein
LDCIQADYTIYEGVILFCYNSGGLVFWAGSIPLPAGLQSSIAVGYWNTEDEVKLYRYNGFSGMKSNLY